MRLPLRGAPWFILPMLPLIVGCASTSSMHYVEIYVTGSGSSCELTADMGRSSIDEVYVFPKDVIVWVNTTGGDVEIELDTGIIADTSVRLAPGKRAMTPVIATSGDSFPITVKCLSGGGSSGPKIIVGDPP